MNPYQQQVPQVNGQAWTQQQPVQQPVYQQAQLPFPQNGQPAAPPPAPTAVGLRDMLRSRKLDPSGYESDEQLLDELLQVARQSQEQQAELEQLRQQQQVAQQVQQIQQPEPQPDQGNPNLDEWRRFVTLGEDGRVQPKPEAAFHVPVGVINALQKERDDQQHHLQSWVKDPRKAIEEFGGSVLEEKIQAAIEADRASREHEQSIEKYIDQYGDRIYNEDGSLSYFGSELLNRAAELKKSGIPDQQIFQLSAQHAEYTSMRAGLQAQMEAWQQSQQAQQTQQQAAPAYQLPPGMNPAQQQPAPQNNFGPGVQYQPGFQQPAQQPVNGNNGQHQAPAQQQTTEPAPQPPNGNFFQRNHQVPPGAMQTQSREVPDQTLSEDETLDTRDLVEGIAREHGLVN